ncbi:MAG: flagellar hook-basal body protein, partial [Planctomycetales bacterium]|nr:flagellar hook-basal body protein [Planctomycetales bacterium]
AVWRGGCIASGRTQGSDHDAIGGGNMPYGMYISAEGAAAQSKRMEVLANNLANVDTPGFKRQFAVLQARHAEALLQGIESPGDGSLSDLGGGIEIPETLTDFSPGTLRKTDVPTDLAIEGDAMFIVENADGEQMLTKAGNFRLTSEGELITQEGDAVLSQDLAPIQLLPGVPWTVSKNGMIHQGASQVALGLMKPEFVADLIPAGDNLFRPLAAPQPAAPEERQVISGFLELSSVKPTTEMMQMIEASRAFESNVRLIQHQDQAIGNLLSRVLRQS